MTNQEIIIRGELIRDETVTGANTAQRVGEAFVAIGENLVKNSDDIDNLEDTVSQRYEYSDFKQGKFFITGDYAIDDVLSEAPAMNSNTSFGCLLLEIASGTKITIATKSGNTGRTYCIVSKETGVVLAIDQTLNGNLYDNPFTYLANEDVVAYINDKVSTERGYVIVTPSVTNEFDGVKVRLKALEEDNLTYKESIDLNRENIEILRAGGDYVYRKSIPEVSVVEGNYIVPPSQSSTTKILIGASSVSERCLAFYPVRKGYTYSIHIPKTTNPSALVWGYIESALAGRVTENTVFNGATPDLTTGNNTSMDLSITSDRLGDIVVAYNTSEGLPTVVETFTETIRPTDEQISMLKTGGAVTTKTLITPVSSIAQSFILPPSSTNADRIYLKQSGNENFSIAFVEITDGRSYKINCHGTNTYGLRWGIFGEDEIPSEVIGQIQYTGAILDLTTSESGDLEYTTPPLTTDYGNYLVFSYDIRFPFTVNEIETLEKYNGLANDERDIQELGERVTALEDTPNTKVMEAASRSFRENARLGLRPVVILGIGNSWTENATTYLGKILHNLGISSIIYRSMYGGAPLKKYADNIDSNAAEFQVFKSVDDGSWVTIADENHKMCLRDILALETWDIVTFQQKSVYAGDYSTFQPYLNKLLNFERESDEIWAKIYFHSTWAYPDGMENADFTSLYNGDSDTMYQAILDAWSEAIDDTGIFNVLPITPIIKECAAIWDTAGHAMLGGSYSFYTSDGSHLGSTGYYAAALGWAETLIKTFFYPSAIGNKTILDCTFEPNNLYSTEFAAFRSKVSQVVANYKSYYDCFE